MSVQTTNMEFSDEISIKEILLTLRRWTWLLAAGLALGLLSGFLFSAFQTPIYQASTRVLVLRASQTDKNVNTYLSDQQLVQTYIQLLKTRSALEGASGFLGYEVEEDQINVVQIRDVQAIELTVDDANPQHAADIANSLVKVLIMQNEAIQAGRYTSTEESIQTQITQIENQISQMNVEIENVSIETVQQQIKQVEEQIALMQAEVAQLQAEIQQLTPPVDSEQQLRITEKEARINQITPVITLSQQIYTNLVVLGKPSTSLDGINKLTKLETTLKLYQDIYINLLNNLEAVRLSRLQNTPNVVAIEAAVVPEKPVRPRVLLNTGLTALSGLILAICMAFLFDFLDDTIRTTEDVERILNLPVIGHIGNFNVSKDTVSNNGGNIDLHVLNYPRSPFSEAFRSLRTNLEFTNVDRSINRILVTSSAPGEGKSTVASNLAAIMAQGGKRVLLIDGDMRRPRIHQIFGISNHLGLSSLFRGTMPVSSAFREIAGLNNVLVLPSGNLPPNPTELLASARMDQILLDASKEVDLIIIDSPPSIVADYQVLSTKVDGVLLVITPGVSHAESASTMLNMLRRVNGVPLGVVLNRISRSSHFYGGYYYSNNDNTDAYLGKNKDQWKAVKENRSAKPLEQPALNISYEKIPTEDFPALLLLSEDGQSLKKNNNLGNQKFMEPLPKPEQGKEKSPIVRKDVLEEMYKTMKANKP